MISERRRETVPVAEERRSGRERRSPVDRRRPGIDRRFPRESNTPTGGFPKF
jgi:hypothetical protein